MRETDSVAVYFVRVMTHALRQQPQRLAAVLREAGIDPALLDQPRARVPGSAFAALWLIQIRELQDEFFQLDSRGMPPGAFALICRGLIQEPNLEKALRQCLNNFGLFLRDVGASLSLRGKRAVISKSRNIFRIFRKMQRRIAWLENRSWGVLGNRFAIETRWCSVISNSLQPYGP